MANDRPRRSAARWSALLQVEGLEGRVLLSGLAPHQNSIQKLGIDTPGMYVSQQASSFDVTLGRDASNGRHNLLNVPLSVNFSASLGSTTSAGDRIALPASASNTFTPVSESITFPAGVAIETVRIPVNPGATNPGLVPIELSVSAAAPGVSLVSDGGGVPSAVVYLVTGPAALPPPPAGMTNAHLIVQGKTVSGIAITFSRPMASSSVENVHNYAVTKPGPAVTDWLSRQSAVLPSPVPLKAALYDPTTYTVTLIPEKPLKTSVLYTIQNAHPVTTHNTLTDLQGTAVQGYTELPGTAFLRGAAVQFSGAGTFFFSLKGDRSLNWAAPQPAPIFDGN
jgi:hypothetical protein